jgi:hypothetical protein
MMTDYKSLAERIRQTLAEGGNCDLNTEEWRAVADLLERQAIDSVKVEKALERIKSLGLKEEIRTVDDVFDEMKDLTLFELADTFCGCSNLLCELIDLLESEDGEQE